MLENYWYIVCSSKELGNRPLARTLFAKPIVLFRDQQGKAIALEDRCRHRNAPLSQGKVCGNSVQCPYHGWRYDAKGCIVDIPALGPQPSSADAGVTGVRFPSGVAAYACLEQQGYIWVCMGQVSSQKPLPFAGLSEKGWVNFRMKTRFTAPVDACLENFLDCPHATYVHKGWFRSPTRRKVRAVVTTLDDGAQAEYFDEPREKSAVWTLLSPGKATMQHTDRFIAPATSRVDYSFSNGMHYIISSACTPVDNETTDVYTVITFRIKWIGHLVALYFKPLSRLIIKQDVDVLLAQTANIKKFGSEDFVVLDTDLLIKAIRQWRRAIDKGVAPPAAGQQQEFDLYL